MLQINSEHWFFHSYCVVNMIVESTHPEPVG